MNAVISVIGKDRVGIIARLANICADNNVNIDDITQKVLHETFTMIMWVSMSEKSEKDFSNEVEKLIQNFFLIPNSLFSLIMDFE